jgi:hypothetical protein
MNRHPSTRTRLTLLAVAVVAAAALFAMPTTALAHSATRIVVASETILDNMGVSPFPYALTAKLQRKISGTHYHALSGTVKVYRYNPDTGLYVYKTSRKGSTVSLPIPERGEYKLVYSGSHTTKACTAYTTVYETIGDTITGPTISIDAVEGSLTQSWVTLKYIVGWNAAAWDDAVVFTCEAWFENDFGDQGAWVYAERKMVETGTVEFDFKVENSELLARLKSKGKILMEYFDPYILPASEIIVDWPVPH